MIFHGVYYIDGNSYKDAIIKYKGQYKIVQIPKSAQITQDTLPDEDGNLIPVKNDVPSIDYDGIKAGDVVVWIKNDTTGDLLERTDNHFHSYYYVGMNGKRYNSLDSIPVLTVQDVIKELERH